MNIFVCFPSELLELDIHRLWNKIMKQLKFEYSGARILSNYTGVGSIVDCKSVLLILEYRTSLSYNSVIAYCKSNQIPYTYISIGDYVFTGGEIPAMVLIDSVSRYIEGVLNQDSIKEESFSNGLLEYPQYTRPEIFEGETVPSVLLSGHHENIENWRKEQSLKITKNKRPDLI